MLNLGTAIRAEVKREEMDRAQSTVVRHVELSAGG